MYRKSTRENIQECTCVSTTIQFCLLQNPIRHSSTRSFAGHPYELALARPHDEMHSTICTYDITDLSNFQGKGRIFERFLHLIMSEPA